MADPAELQQRFYDEVLNAIHAEEAYEPKARVTIYERTRDALNETLQAFDPPLSDRDANQQRRALANAIRELNADFKADKIELPEGYTPPVPGSRATTYTEEELATVANAKLSYEFKPPSFTQLLKQKLRVWLALFSRANQQQAASDPFALLWMLAEPLFQIGVVVAVYLVMQRTMILDMPALPFAVIGVSGWLIFRITFTRTMRDLGADAPLTALPLVSPLDVYLARAITLAFLYMTGTVILLALIGWFDPDGFEAPQSILSFIGLWLSLWAMGLGGGMLTGFAASFYPGIRRLAPMALRVMFFFSGIMFVTEQLPTEFKSAFLWNPLTHAIQLMRDAYFVEYATTDGALWVVAFTASALVLAGLAGERVRRRQVAKP